MEPGSSSGGEPPWGEPELWAVLDGDPDALQARYIAITGQHVHVGAAIGNSRSRHWVLDRETAEATTSSPVGGPILVTQDFVYSSGYRTGELVDGEWAVARMDHDGANEVEVLVIDDGLLHAFAASSSAVFVDRRTEPSSQHELWRVVDGELSATLLLDVGEQNMASGTHDDGRLLVQDLQGPSILALDLDTLMFEPLLFPPEPSYVLGVTPDHIFAAQSTGMLRASKDDLVLDQIHSVGPTTNIVGDHEAVYWVGSVGEALGLFMVPHDGTDVQMVPVEYGPGNLRSLALTDDAIYFVRGQYVSPREQYSGSVWRLARP